MNKIKEALININPRMKGLIIIMIAYGAIVLTMINTSATNEIEDYVETVDVQVQDGVEQAKGYLVRQQEVSTVLSDLEIQLNEADKVNHELNYIVNKGDLIQISRVKSEEVYESVSIPSNTVTSSNGLELFTTKVSQEGQPGEIKNTYKVTYENGNEISRELVSSETITPATDTVVESGTVQAGAYFTGRLTTYGGDCPGGNGASSVGISLSPETGVQGTNSAKLNYNGQSYYCLAADPSIPFGTIIEITNHKLSIESTAYGIVVDRGGAIKGAKIDIFNGTEAGKYFTGDMSTNTQFKIVSVGSGRNFWK